MPRRSASGTLSVPMSNPRYTAVESQFTISPRNRSASASASALLPVAVGPSTATTSGSGKANEDVDDEQKQEKQKAELLRTSHFSYQLSAVGYQLRAES